MIGHGSLKPILTNNKNLLRKKSFFKRESSFFERRKKYAKSLTGELELKSISKRDLRTIKSKTIKSQKKEIERRFFLLFLLLLPILAFTMYFSFIAKQESEKKVVDAHLVYI